MYRARYRRDLDELNATMVELMQSVSIAIEQSVRALQERDVELARAVIQGDQAVDDMNTRLENKCMELLALQQPMAKDLRMIVGILKIGIDLERASDLAVDVARVAVQSKAVLPPAMTEDLKRMADIAQQMLKDVMRSLSEGNADIAREATKWDYEMDRLYVKARDNLIKTAAENSDQANDLIPLMMANRHLERIGDHICNICEHIIYMIEGKREHLN
ncbi:MAG: transcriptional regulator PhoU [Methanosaeta sp. PtaB.Bin039]|nr:MAG: transcriptional regulator PhoU [Methanosaeta sp. PtaB.Bin039]OPY46551.1 MAG: transcriptional regulator PhoU [Methanosaeta sp. PtaU1.Bin028]HOT08071.1 phosphate signaling complex protein PhoU [Methanotrichaceae archaeon]HQF17532.1 phosphate signaling complex protein PhoU [Methanotrichaceae archaeon]HQI92125.1 phosphate signaling complex protein PhoU [Methanotrichaceae archaeon]